MDSQAFYDPIFNPIENTPGQSCEPLSPGHSKEKGQRESRASLL